ncbi:MAG TPA: hypothetical protein VNI01_02510, partial [Elusimicrobiota bacterium]|nr:hypothetical protein [Elusimicrobiota bacterium]
MSGSVRFCRAEGELAERAGALLDATPMAGLARLSTRRPAGLLASLRAEGRRRDVIAVRAGDEVVGVGVRGEKECFVDGRPEPATVGYLSGLRVREDHRGGLVLARGYRFLRELHRAGRARCYLTTVLESNAEALRLLGSGRAGLPAYEDWGAIETSLFSPRRAARRLAAASRGPRVRSARAEDRPAAAAFLRAQGPRRQFFPAYEAGDLGSDDGLLPGLGLDDLLLAEDAAGLAGCAGVWDPSRFKTWAVAGYGFPLGAFRGAANLWAAARGLPSWPAPGAAAG